MSDETQASVEETIEALQSAGIVQPEPVEEKPVIEAVGETKKRKRSTKKEENVEAPPEPVYDKEYFDNYDLGMPYGFVEPWTGFFGGIANRLVTKYRPKTAIDVGAAFGILVNALRNRKVDAVGIDISEYAAAQSPSNMVTVKDLSAEWEAGETTYDLITCIEVLEHIPAELAERAIANLVSLAHDNSVIVFSSVPPELNHEDDELHANVQDETYWLTLFAAYTPPLNIRSQTLLPANPDAY